MRRILALTSLCLLFAVPAFGAITFDAVTVSAEQVSISNFNFSHTVGAGCTNPIIVATVQWQGDTTAGSISALTIGGSAATSKAGQTITGFNRRVEMWRRVATGTGAKTIDITFTDLAVAAFGVAVSYCGVDQTTPEGTPATAEGTTSPVTVNVTNAAGDLAVDATVVRFAGSTSLTVGGGQTQRANTADSNSNIRIGNSEESGTGTITMSWTLGTDDVWATVAMPLKPAATRRAVAPIIFP